MPLRRRFEDDLGLLEVWWEGDVATCLMPFYLNSRRASA
jgi:hypothetical protein